MRDKRVRRPPAPRKAGHHNRLKAVIRPVALSSAHSQQALHSIYLMHLHLHGMASHHLSLWI